MTIEQDRYSKTLMKDIETIINTAYIPWDTFRNKSILVTGATGLVGSLLCRVFLAANRRYDLRLSVFALVRNEEKARKLLADCVEDAALNLLKGDVTNPLQMESGIDYVFHCASVTASKQMISNPVDTLMTAVQGTYQMLKFAQEKEVESFVYVSSMEMYGSFDQALDEVKETDLGYINPLAVRSNYPESKRLCENMCVAFWTEYQVPVRIARLAQTFGAGILPGENRVFAQFARAVLKGEDIVLHTKGLSEGNYCYTADCMKGLLLIAAKGENGEAYNVSNPDTHTTIAGMAEMAAKDLAGGRIKVVYDIPEGNVFGYAADTKMKLNSDKLKSLGWKPEVGLREAYQRMMNYMLETEKEAVSTGKER